MTSTTTSTKLCKPSVSTTTSTKLCKPSVSTTTSTKLCKPSVSTTDIQDSEITSTIISEDTDTQEPLPFPDDEIINVVSESSELSLRIKDLEIKLEASYTIINNYKDRYKQCELEFDRMQDQITNLTWSLKYEQERHYTLQQEIDQEGIHN